MVTRPLLLLQLLLRRGAKGISWERRIRFELCILTATETEETSPGNGLSTVSRVMTNEHNLQAEIDRQRERRNLDRGLFLVYKLQSQEAKESLNEVHPRRRMRHFVILLGARGRW